MDWRVSFLFSIYLSLASVLLLQHSPYSNSHVWPGCKERALSHCIPIFPRHSSAKSLRSFIFIAARAAIYRAFIKNHISEGRTVEAEDGAGGCRLSGGDGEQKDRTACAGSCCLDAGWGVGGWGLCLTPCQADRPPQTWHTAASSRLLHWGNGKGRETACALATGSLIRKEALLTERWSRVRSNRPGTIQAKCSGVGQHISLTSGLLWQSILALLLWWETCCFFM